MPVADGMGYIADSAGLRRHHRDPGPEIISLTERLTGLEHSPWSAELLVYWPG